MNDARHECRCGKPIHDGAHLCHACIGQLRRDLRTLAERWSDLEAALTSPEAAPLHLVAQPGTEDNTGNAVGIELNTQVTNARTAVAGLAWFVVGVLRDDYDDARKEFRPPADQSVPSLLLWIERWHVDHLMREGVEETALDIAADARKAEKQTYRALNAARTVYVGIPCVEHATTDLGERVPCTGQMTARAVPGVMSDLVCTADSAHRIEPGQWQRDGWRGRFARPLHPGGLSALASRLNTRRQES